MEDVESRPSWRSPVSTVTSSFTPKKSFRQDSVLSRRLKHTQGKVSDIRSFGYLWPFYCLTEFSKVHLPSTSNTNINVIMCVLHEKTQTRSNKSLWRSTTLLYLPSLSFPHHPRKHLPITYTQHQHFSTALIMTSITSDIIPLWHLSFSFKLSATAECDFKDWILRGESLLDVFRMHVFPSVWNTFWMKRKETSTQLELSLH